MKSNSCFRVWDAMYCNAMHCVTSVGLKGENLKNTNFSEHRHERDQYNKRASSRPYQPEKSCLQKHVTHERFEIKNIYLTIEFQKESTEKDKKNLLLQDESHFILAVECVVQVEKFAVVELVHYVDLTTDCVLAQFIRGLQEFANIVLPCGFLNHSMDDAECPAEKKNGKKNLQLKTR